MTELIEMDGVLDDSSGEMSPSSVFSLLSNDRRLRVIEILSNTDHRTIRGIADEIARSETDGEPGAYDRKKSHISLYQCHMPKMDDAGIVEWDKRSGSVERGENYEHAHSILNSVLSMYQNE